MSKIEVSSATMTPREIVQELDRHIVGQHDAKRAVAIALRNRWRRMQLVPELRNEVMPKNILMIGPTGVGKTEIARRLATLAAVREGRSHPLHRSRLRRQGRRADHPRPGRYRGQALSRTGQGARTHQAEERAEDRILDALLPRRSGGIGFDPEVARNEPSAQDNETRIKFRKMLRNGELDEREIELDLAANVSMDIMTPPGMEEMGQQLKSMFANLGGGAKAHKRTLTIRPRARC